MSDNRKGSKRNQRKTGNGGNAGKHNPNPNLRLVKNGDRPVEREAPEKETPKTEVPKSTAVRAEEPEKSAAKRIRKEDKPPADREKTVGKARKREKPKAPEKKTADEKAEHSGSTAAEKRKTTGGKSASGKKTTTEGKPGTGKKTTAGGKSGTGKKEIKSGQAAGQKKRTGSGKAADGRKKKKRGPEADIWDYGKKPKETKEERPDAGEWFAQHKSLVISGFTIFMVAALLAAGYYYIVTTYTVTTVYVDGNIHYTNEEVMDLVMEGRYGKNSLYLAVKYRDRGVEGVPFVEKMDINILSPDTIRINVYEKALAGYVEYLGQYMYFDKDGIVTESSPVKTSGIPQVTGLDFSYVVLNEPLPVENDEIFKGILNITQLLTKYGLAADKIFFDSAYDVTLYFGGVRVTLGTGENMEEKFMKLKNILPELEGRKGLLRMDNYSEDSKNIPFNPD